MTIVETTKENECCCSCIHNIRKGEISNLECWCDIDEHYIGYVECFIRVCEEWKGENNDKRK